MKRGDMDDLAFGLEGYINLLEEILLLGISIIGIVQGIYLIFWPDPHSAYDKVGPGLFLILISLLIMITVIVHIIRHVKYLPEGKLGPDKKGAAMRLSFSFGIFAIYIGLLHVIGFLPATMIFLFLVFWFLGVRSWVRNTILSVIFSISFYLVFVEALNMELPRGLFLN